MILGKRYVNFPDRDFSDLDFFPAKMVGGVSQLAHRKQVAPATLAVSRKDRVEELLKTLVAMGQAREITPGQFLAG